MLTFHTVYNFKTDNNILFDDYSGVPEPQFVVVDCDSGTFDSFACERAAWDCSANAGLGSCSDECDAAGFCTCPEGKFLTDFFTCAEEPSLQEIECFDTHMVAWFPVRVAKTILYLV